MCVRVLCIASVFLTLVTTQASAQTPKVAKEDLRYDGKDFAYWQNYWRTELKTEWRIEVVRAMGAFGADGYGVEAARMIIEVVQGSRDDDFEQPHLDQKPVFNAEQQLIQAAVDNLDKIGAPAYTALAQNWSKPSIDKLVDRFFMSKKTHPKAIGEVLKVMFRDKATDVRENALHYLVHGTEKANVAEFLKEDAWEKLSSERRWRMT